MKKLLSIALSLALVVTLFVGCGASAAQPTDPVPSQPLATEPVVTEPIATEPPVTEPATKISRDQALQIALDDAGLTQDQIHDLEVELDNDGGALHFDVDFEVSNKDYDYEIDAEDGKILKKQIPEKEAAATSSTTSSTSSSSKQISRTEARDIALKHAGLSTSQVRDLEVELDKDDGKVHYDVDFEADGYDYDYEIDAQSGKILKSKKEKD